MSSGGGSDDLSLAAEAAARLGADTATRIRLFRLVLGTAQQLRTLMDERLRPDGLTTQQAAVITVVEAAGAPTLSAVASAIGTTHQNVKQLAVALERKGFLRIDVDPDDRRARRLRVTTASDRHWAERSEQTHRDVLEWFAELTPEEATTLFDLLARLRASVSAATAASRPG